MVKVPVTSKQRGYALLQLIGFMKKGKHIVISTKALLVVDLFMKFPPKFVLLFSITVLAVVLI